ncbi:MAG: amidase [Chromatiales bacterium]|jgi:amidase|nr:amidase [Chromatiales bacterium]
MKDSLDNRHPPLELGFEDPVNAFCRHTHVALDGAASGPLHGLKFAAKDVFHIAGHRTGFGQPDWLRTHPPASVTADAVTRLLDSGASMIGKTHSDELAYSLTGENVHYGTPINSRAPQRIPGGSSNGSAAAVAGGLVDFALGTDCGGSVRLPASYCGILGIRPTRDRVSLAGVIPFGPPFDVAGWFARDADTLHRVGRVLLNEHGVADMPRRALIARDGFDWIDGQVGRALQGAVAKVTEALGEQQEVVISEVGLPHWFETFRTLQAASIWANHGSWIRETRPTFGPGIKERLEWAEGVTEQDVRRAKVEHQKVCVRLDQLLGAADVLLLPTSPRVAPLKNTPVDEIEVKFRNQAMHLLCIAGLGGLPQLSLPLAELDGLPLGLSLVGRRGADMALLALARRVLGN